MPINDTFAVAEVGFCSLCYLQQQLRTDQTSGSKDTQHHQQNISDTYADFLCQLQKSII